MKGEKEGEESYRTAQPSTLAAFLPWGSSKGASHMTLTSRKSIKNSKDEKENRSIDKRKNQEWT